MSFLTEAPQYVGAFFLLLGVLIFLHEWGHYAMARFFGVKVETFSIGFGKKLLSKKIGDTDFSLSLIPLGGYVKMYGDQIKDEIPEDQKHLSFAHKKVWQRMAVVLAGPLMNLFVAICLFSFIGLFGPEQQKPVVGTIDSTSVAYENWGFREGDLVTGLNDQKVKSWEDFVEAFESLNPGEHSVQVLRAGTEMNLKGALAQTDLDKVSPINPYPPIGGLSNLIMAASVGVLPESEAALSGIKNLSFIKKVSGTEVNSFSELKKQVDQNLKNGQGIILETEKQEYVFKGLKEFKDLGLETLELYVGQVQSSSPAKVAGLLRGDRLVQISGNFLNSWSDVLENVKDFNPENDKPLSFTILREGKQKEFTITPEIKNLVGRQGQDVQRAIIGVVPGLTYQAPQRIRVPQGGLFGSIKYGVYQSYKWSKMTFEFIGKLIFQKVSHKNLSGILTIGQVAKESLNLGFLMFLNVMAVISINLFVLNLLPIPVLDGGHLVFYIIEAVKGSPLSPRKMEFFLVIGFVLLLSLMFLTIYNDVIRIFFSGW